ncbi:MAG: DEAD/DEAH box helicase family protein [Clostridia bacterium]|nr:DEAD/DEAH box helicase family protein [Clostridia bacterium]
MGFQELDIKRTYINKGDDNFVDKFLNPALREAKLYRRAAADFSSSVFNLILNSLPTFVHNGGKIELVISPELQKEDVEAIEAGLEAKDKKIGEVFLKQFNNELAHIDKNGAQVLYELIANDILNIKIASVKTGYGMYHDKIGILTDNYGNDIVFIGSPNSSYNAYINNYEKIRIRRGWVDSESEDVKDEIDEFSKLWDKQNEYLEIYNFKEALLKNIIHYCETAFPETGKDGAPVKLFPYQEEAVSNWVNNGYKGFYTMATGTGKTWTAIFSAKRLLEKEGNKLIVIAAPYKHLVKQWCRDVAKMFKENTRIVLVSSENPEWENEVSHAIIARKYDPDVNIVIITTIKSFYLDKFFAVLSKSDSEKLLIVDEAHRFTKRDKAIDDMFLYKLGLSATPMNGKNSEEGKELIAFFGGQVFSLPIEDALEKGFLLQYNYYPKFVYATFDEEYKFNKYTSDMFGCYNKQGELVDKEKLFRLIRARLRVLAMSAEKLSHVDEYFNLINPKNHFIVYCGDGRLNDEEDTSCDERYIQKIHNMLDSKGYKICQFTCNEKMDRRMDIIDDFDQGIIDGMVAIKCLDEGIDIPSIKSALILASNDDYREFVQRRGRILRKHPSKTIADIFDVIVLPQDADSKKMALIELRRFYEYAKLSYNKESNLNLLNNKLNEYGLTIDDVKFYVEVNEEVSLDE